MLRVDESVIEGMTQLITLYESINRGTNPSKQANSDFIDSVRQAVHKYQSHPTWSTEKVRVRYVAQLIIHLMPDDEVLLTTDEEVELFLQKLADFMLPDFEREIQTAIAEINAKKLAS